MRRKTSRFSADIEISWIDVLGHWDKWIKNIRWLAETNYTCNTWKLNSIEISSFEFQILDLNILHEGESETKFIRKLRLEISIELNSWVRH